MNIQPLILDLLKSSAYGFTTAEIATALSCSKDRAYQTLRRMSEAGLIDRYRITHGYMYKLRPGIH